MVHKILLPPGIGDIYWVLVKLPAFLEREGITQNPKVSIWGEADPWRSELRSIPFLRMVKSVRISVQRFIRVEPKESRYYVNCCTDPGHSFSVPPIPRYHYFGCYNGAINGGLYLEDLNDGLACNWYPDFVVSSEEEKFREQCLEKFGKYAVFYWPFSHHYVGQLREFTFDRMVEAVNLFTSRSKTTPVFVGALWDTAYDNEYLKTMIKEVKGAVDLVGKTTLEKAFGLIKGAEMVVGYHSGLTNMAIVFKKKTLLLWCKSQFQESVPWSVAPPETRGCTYWPTFTEELAVNTLVGKLMDLYEQN